MELWPYLHIWLSNTSNSKIIVHNSQINWWVLFLGGNVSKICGRKNVWNVFGQNGASWNRHQVHVPDAAEVLHVAQVVEVGVGVSVRDRHGGGRRDCLWEKKCGEELDEKMTDLALWLAGCLATLDWNLCASCFFLSDDGSERAALRVKVMEKLGLTGWSEDPASDGLSVKNSCSRLPLITLCARSRWSQG
jgi:hypothetical protein